nr:MAG TPA: hypothetical protein [Caudoviricetes sp.]
MPIYGLSIYTKMILYCFLCRQAGKENIKHASI